MGTAADVVALIGGGLIVLLTVLSAISTVVVPRGIPVRLSRLVFLWIRRVFELRGRAGASYEQRDRAMALYAPVSLIMLPLVWLALVMVGFTAIFWGLGVEGWAEALEASGSSVTTLGFVAVDGIAQYLAAFAAAGLGLLLLALVITYLPSMYAAFSRREALVSMTAIQAGSPPTGVELLERFHVLADLDRLDADVWAPWTAGFVDLEETHTSLGALAFFRSPQPQRSWVTAAGAVLDGASLLSSTVEGPRSPPAELCIRAGTLALREIATFYGIEHDPDPSPGDPVLVSREEWEAARHRLGDAGVALVADADEAWRHFQGWRVNYDVVLVALADLTMAPYAPWSSDRSPRVRHRPRVRRPRPG